MNKINKENAKEELKKIYDSKYKWIQAGEALRSRFGDSIDNSPKLKWILILCILANIGIWSTFIMLSF